MQSVGPDTAGQLTPAAAEEYYDAEFDSRAEARRARRLEFRYGRQVHEWFSEGVPLDAMGDPAAVQRYRDRRDSPVPWDIEAFNRASRRRNTGRVQRSRQPSAGGDPTRSGERGGENGGSTERRSAGVPESVRDVVAAPGRSLDGEVQRTMEDRMDEDFGDVRVHTGPRAAQACEDIDALAFTVGNHVAFDRGEYDPGSRQGRHLIAHELAHVRQQTGGRVSMLPRGGLQIDPDDRLEREAAETARRVVNGAQSARGTRRVGYHVQRWRDQPRDEQGRFAEKPREQYEGKKYSIRHRPPYAPGQVEEVWQRAKRESPDGNVRDPNTGEVLEWDRTKSRKGQWHMGHKPRREYRFLLEYYLRGVISERRFVAEYQDPDHYRPEAPTANRSGKYEGGGEYWARTFGPLEPNQ